MNAAVLILLVIAFVLALLAAFGVGSRLNLLALAIATWILAELLPKLATLG